MSQFGMQMPGGRTKRGSSPDAFTALAVVATVFLGVACALMWRAAAHVGVDGSPYALQDVGKIKLPASASPIGK